MKQAKEDHEQKTHYESVSGCGEQRAGFAHAAQVRNRDERDEDQTQKDLVIVQPCVACSLDRRGNRGYSGRVENRRVRAPEIDTETVST